MKKTRRGYGKGKNRMKVKNNSGKVRLSLFGTNANGIISKIDSLKHNINIFNPSIITLQETKVKRKGLVKLPGYQVFELPRVEGSRLGLLTAINDQLSPVVITADEDSKVEVLTVQLRAGNSDLRVINAYGPQEDACNDDILIFWQVLEEEILSAKANNCLVIVQLDANAKVGGQLILGDPHSTSDNGKLLIDLTTRQNLTICNSLNHCQGVITRERETIAGSEKSVLDYVLVCDRLKDSVDRMFIDENRMFTLTRFSSKKVTKSDHNVMHCTFDIVLQARHQSVRKEIFKLKDKEGQKTFLELTSIENAFSGIFSTETNFSIKANMFLRKLTSTMHRSFTKVRIIKGKKTHYKSYELTLLEKRKQLLMFLKACSCSETKHIVNYDLLKIEECLANFTGNKNALLVKEHVKALELSDGKMCNNRFWKLKRKLCPNTADPPMAKRDMTGNIVTAPDLLKSLYGETYKTRLRNRDIKPELLDLFLLKEELWSSRYRELRIKTTADWSIPQLRAATKKLKNNKAVDPNLMINELLKHGYIGPDLENALLLLCNGIKNNFTIPDFMSKQNICTVYKNKGSRLDMKNERGIFLLTSLRKVLDNLLYHDLYEDIDENMSDSNVGARRGRQVKNHLFIMHGVINSVVNGTEACIDIQFYDLEQAFDSLWLSDCMLDVYDTLPPNNRDEKLALVYKLSEENQVAVSTPHGLTERMSIPEIVQQGGTWGPVLCSNSIDSIGKKLWRRGQTSYLYKNSVNILPLAMVDDIGAISKCGQDSLILNNYLNTQIELKKLRFHTPDSQGKTKCHKLHVGVKSGRCPTLKVHGTVMEEVSEDEYLGDVISDDGKNKMNLKKRLSRGLGLITQIINILESVSFGYHYIEIALVLRESMFVNSVLSNVEVWYGMTKMEIDALEKLDLMLLRKILKAPVSTPKEAFYLELGILPLGIVLKMRRVKYLYYLITRNRTEMLSKFFWTQWKKPDRQDWTETVRQDLADFGMSADPEYLEKYSKYSFKNQVKIKAKELAFKLLMKRKDTHSKMSALYYTNLAIQSYFFLPGCSISDLRSVFLFRVRMHDYNDNFRAGSEVGRLCPLCNIHNDNQNLISQCTVIKENIKGNIQQIVTNIYSPNIVITSVKKLAEISALRENLLGKSNK